MDMVFTAKEDSDLDPLTTKIEVVNDGTYLKSDGNTSLGSDDGIGLAIALNIADGKMKHGPLRIIVTTDEEHGLECGEFASANKNLNMVAVGPTITDPHTVDEKLEIASIQKVWELLEAVLANIS